MFIYCDNDVDDFGLVQGSICREGERGDIIGGKAAPDGVATEHIFGYGEEGGGCIVLCLCLCDIMRDIIQICMMDKGEIIELV